jgi:hypothetical protein
MLHKRLSQFSRHPQIVAVGQETGLFQQPQDVSTTANSAKPELDISIVAKRVEIDLYRSLHRDRSAVLGCRRKPPIAHGLYGRDQEVRLLKWRNQVSITLKFPSLPRTLSRTHECIPRARGRVLARSKPGFCGGGRGVALLPRLYTTPSNHAREKGKRQSQRHMTR